MISRDKVAVLVIAFQRVDSVKEILRVAALNGHSNLYVAIDGPRNEREVENRELILRAIEEIEETFSIEISKLVRTENVGCAPAVLSACDWMFQNEYFGIILEDDCIPTNDFFDFSNSALKWIDEKKNIWLGCGSQFAPQEITFPGEPWVLSRYSLTWGWCTTKEKWKAISDSFRDTSNKKYSRFYSVEEVYWNAGARRANYGITDVWDTVLVRNLRATNNFAILPSTPLVKNIGNDSLATHTIGFSNWLNVETGRFQFSSHHPVFSREVDQWLRRNFFKIRFRHYFSTNITFICDYICHRLKDKQTLIGQWLGANSYWE